jgi:DHA1 family tetracycline resistance protein-like MFS transporter
MAGVPLMSMWGFAGPPVQSIMTRRVGVNEQGKLQGANQGVTSIAAIFGPGLYGTLYALFNGKLAYLGLPGFPFLVSSGFLLLAFIMAFVAAKDARAREAVAAAE